MATNRRTKMDIVLIFMFVFLSSNSVVFGKDKKNPPNPSIMHDWVKSIKGSVLKVLGSSSFKSFMEDDYKKINIKNFHVEFEKVNLDNMVDQMSVDLSAMLSKKMDALNNSVVRAERAASDHDWITNIKKEDVPYQNANTLMENDTRLVYNDRFKQRVITNISSVHIPVEIFSGDVEILNGLKWSAALDEIFSENYEKDPEILWQYFGSQTGFMRTLPASIWKKESQSVDLYDVRRRPWYTQGASSPKDMFILIDKSGSVHGQTLELIKVSVKSLLDTLGENDFVNIAQFNESVKLLTDCFNGTFVQANYRNKQILMQEVEKIEAGGMADFKAGLTFSFEQFERLKDEPKERHGANCNRMIMLLTDGGSELAEDVFKKYNPEGNKTYRVFTYAVGPTANPVSAIRWMACVNRGFFSQIPAMGAIRSKVQEYVDVISRPLALSQVEHGLWTSVHTGLYQPAKYLEKPAKALETYALPTTELFQYTIKNDPRGLGMVTTVTLPVYNKTAGSTNQTILGVMGVDVTTDEMLKYAPLRKMGPNGYPFAINTNGYIVFHPKLKHRTLTKDPPNVDFLDVEVENDETLDLRKDMIDGKSGKRDIETYMVSNDLRHVDVEVAERKRRFSYRAIANTTFSLGISLPAYHKYHVKIKADLRKFLDNASNLLHDNETALLIADLDYYKNFTGNKNRNGTIMDLLEALENSDEYEWNEELIGHLLWDIKMTANCNDFWPMFMKGNDTKKTGALLKGMFVGTNGGLTRVYPKSCLYKDLATHGTARDTAYQKKMNAINCYVNPESGDILESLLDKRDTWEANYFKRAVDSPHWIFSAPYVLDPEDPENGTVGAVTAVRTILITYDKLNIEVDYRAAVVGMVFKEDTLKKMMETDTHNVVNISDCGDSQDIACYLLDDGAFIIATNQDQYNTSVGRFFGKVDPELMHELYNKTVYRRTEQFDYQATCIGPRPSEADGQTSAGPLSFRVPSINVLFEFITLNWWTSFVSWAFTSFNLYTMVTPNSPTTVYATIPDKPRMCIKKQAQYYFDENLSHTNGEIECEVRNLRCERWFVAAPIEDTNLLFVVVKAEEPDCKECRTNVKPLLQEPREDEPEFCELKPRYRRATETCYDHDEREDESQCTASFTHPVSTLFVSCVAIVTILLTQR